MTASAPKAESARHWVVDERGRVIGRSVTRLGAIRLADRRSPRLGGRWAYVRAYSQRTGEEWERRFGIWFKTGRLAPEFTGEAATQALAKAEAAAAAPAPWWSEM